MRRKWMGVNETYCITGELYEPRDTLLFLCDIFLNSSRLTTHTREPEIIHRAVAQASHRRDGDSGAVGAVLPAT